MYQLLFVSIIVCFYGSEFEFVLLPRLGCNNCCSQNINKTVTVVSKGQYLPSNLHSHLYIWQMFSKLTYSELKIHFKTIP